MFEGDLRHDSKALQTSFLCRTVRVVLKQVLKNSLDLFEKSCVYVFHSVTGSLS